MPSYTLKIRECGHIVSFKNSKMLTHGRLITAPKKQAAMDSYIRAIESALSSMFQTSDTGMATGCSLASWIQSCVPLDDSRHWMPESDGWRFVEVPKGEEGADIIITQL